MKTIQFEYDDPDAVTAIVMHHYEEREPYIRRILDSIEAQTVPPKKIILWINHGRYFSIRGTDTVQVIQSSANDLMGRYSAVFLARTPYVYVQDDDLIVEPKMIECMRETAQQGARGIIGIQGRFYGKNGYTDGNGVYPSTEVQYAQMVLGRCWFARRDALLYGYIQMLRTGIDPGRADDIFFSNRQGHVIPAWKDAGWLNLDEKGVGLSHDPDHMRERDQMVRFLRDIR